MGRVIDAFTQFFDDAGNPLENGWLKFTDSGTTDTLKNTYSDTIHLVANDNPLQLDAAGRCPDVFGTGSYRVVSFTENIEDDSDVGSQVQMFDPVEVASTADSTQGFENYDAAVTYGLGDLVSYSDMYYRSIVVVNLNKNPSTETASWEEVRFIPLWNTNRAYDVYNEVFYEGRIYFSLQNSNSGNQPDTSPFYWSTSVNVGDDIGASGDPVDNIFVTTVEATTVEATTVEATTVEATTVETTNLEIGGVALTATPAEINTAAVNISDPPIAGDSTPGRVLRAVRLAIDDATEAGSISCALSGKFNATGVSKVDDIDDDGVAVGGFSWETVLNRSTITIENSNLDGDVAGVLASAIIINSCGTLLSVEGAYSASGIKVHLYQMPDYSGFNLGTLVDRSPSGAIYISILYLTED